MSNVFKKTQKSEKVGDGLQLTGDDDDNFLKISCTCRKERLPNECSVVKRVKKLSQKAKKQRRKLLYMYMCVCK